MTDTDRTVTMLGLATCDACKKARRALEAAGWAVAFHDVRAEPPGAEGWSGLVATFGSNLVNRASTTWRGLTDWMREAEAETQLAAHPALMKRPVLIEGALDPAGLTASGLPKGTRATLGWDAAIAAGWGA